jgi:hypothetical protein
MQRFELSLIDPLRLLTREPLLIVRLSILKPGLPKTMRPVRKKLYQDHTFALRIPLELDDDGLDSLNLKHLSWSCLLAHAWWRHLQILPLYPIMGEPCLTSSSWIHCKLQTNDIFRNGSCWTCTSKASKSVDQSWLCSLHIDLINFALHLLSP